jgi:serralysin
MSSRSKSGVLKISCLRSRRSGAADQLTGGFGTGADTFHYTALSDSGITAGTRDLIADFNPSDGDKIDLSAIDANTKTPGDDAFNFVGTNIPTGFSGNPGQLHAFWNAVGQLVEGDVNGDKKADFSIEIADPTHAITLTSTSFLL